MKTRALIGLVGLIACAVASELSRQVETRDQNGNGKPDQFYTNSYQNGLLVRAEMASDKNEDGIPEYSYTRLYSGGKIVYFESVDLRLNVRTRVYHADGKPVVFDLSLDGDMDYEWTIVEGSDPKTKTILYRERDGAVRIATEDEMKQIGGVANPKAK